MAIRAKFKPNPEDPTEHHYAIPSRDLDESDWEALDADQKELVRNSPLYEYVPERRTTAAAGEGKG